MGRKFSYVKKWKFQLINSANVSDVELPGASVNLYQSLIFKATVLPETYKGLRPSNW